MYSPYYQSFPFYPPGPPMNQYNMEPRRRNRNNPPMGPGFRYEDVNRSSQTAVTRFSWQHLLHLIESYDNEEDTKFPLQLVAHPRHPGVLLVTSNYDSLPISDLVPSMFTKAGPKCPR